MEDYVASIACRMHHGQAVSESELHQAFEYRALLSSMDDDEQRHLDSHLEHVARAKLVEQAEADFYAWMLSGRYKWGVSPRGKLGFSQEADDDDDGGSKDANKQHDTPSDGAAREAHGNKGQMMPPRIQPGPAVHNHDDALAWNTRRTEFEQWTSHGRWESRSSGPSGREATIPPRQPSRLWKKRPANTSRNNNNNAGDGHLLPSLGSPSKEKGTIGTVKLEYL